MTLLSCSVLLVQPGDCYRLSIVAGACCQTCSEQKLQKRAKLNMNDLLNVAIVRQPSECFMMLDANVAVRGSVGFASSFEHRSKISIMPRQFHMLIFFDTVYLTSLC